MYFEQIDFQTAKTYALIVYILWLVFGGIIGVLRGNISFVGIVNHVLTPVKIVFVVNTILLYTLVYINRLLAYWIGKLILRTDFYIVLFEQWAIYIMFMNSNMTQISTAIAVLKDLKDVRQYGSKSRALQYRQDLQTKKLLKANQAHLLKQQKEYNLLTSQIEAQIKALELRMDM